MRGKLIYVVDKERIKKHKRDISIYLSIALFIPILLWMIPRESSGIPSLLDFSHLKFVIAAWGSIGAVIVVLLWAGVRVQPFGIYERGIVPPLKPWSKMFSKEYFIPYEKMEKIDTDSWKIVEKGGRKSNLRSWFLFNFVRSGKEADMVEEMLKKIAKRVNSGHTKEINESELRG